MKPADLSIWPCLKELLEQESLLAFVWEDRRFIATQWQEMSWQDFCKDSLKSLVASTQRESGWGYVGLIPYDHFSGSSQTSPNPTVYKITEACEFDEQASSLQDDTLSTLEIEASDSVDSYLESATSATTEIRKGRYYQINLLRYFQLHQSTSRSMLLNRMEALGAPFSTVIVQPEFEVWSYSPERFIRVESSADGETIYANPIKGTISAELAGNDSDSGQHVLLNSEKDKAELHMIVDLMRNDLNKVCQVGSVQVPCSHRIKECGYVHHLEAEVTGRLKPDLPLGTLFEALCPAGSITGAPKVEVMKAIREKEGRDRGYFMGNAFYIDKHGKIDMNVLIRTITRTGGDPFEFAAGSGIVLASDPDTELREIGAKCRVLSHD